MTRAFLGTSTPAGWARWTATNAAVGDDGVELARRPGRPEAVLPDARAVDVARDGCGLVYALDVDGSVHRYDPRTGERERFVPGFDGDDEGPPVPRALCVLAGVVYVLTAGRADRDRGRDGDETDESSGARGGGDEAGGDDASGGGDETNGDDRDGDDEGTDEDGVDGSEGGVDADDGTDAGGEGNGNDEDGTGTTGRDAHAAGAGLYAVTPRPLATRRVAVPSPVDPVAVDADRRARAVYVLDRGPGPGEGTLVRVGPGGEAATVLAGLVDPRDVVVDPGGTVHVLDGPGPGPEPAVGSGSGSRPEGGSEPDEATVVHVAVDVGPRGAVEATERGRLGVGETTAALAVYDGPPAGTTPAEMTPAQTTSAEATSAGGDGGGPAAGSDRTLVVATAAGGVARHALVDGVAVSPAASSDRLDRGVARLAAVADGAAAPAGGYYLLAEPPGPVWFAAEAGRVRPDPDTGRYEARLVRRLDSGIPGTRWHRVTLALDEARSAAGGGATSGGVRVRYAGTDDPDVVEEPVERLAGVGPAYAERLRAAGAGLTGLLADWDLDAVVEAVATGPGTVGLVRRRAREWLAVARARAPRWEPVGTTEPTDALVEATGRYLWVELTLYGDERASSRVSSFRAYFPRDSYLRHLPAVYRSDERSAAFLERFLSVVESGFVEADEALDGFTRHLDPRTVPTASVPWLGEWLGVTADERWPEPVARAFLEHAPALSRARGTPSGLLAAVRLALDPDDWVDPTGVEGDANAGGRAGTADGSVDGARGEADEATEGLPGVTTPGTECGEGGEGGEGAGSGDDEDGDGSGNEEASGDHAGSTGGEGRSDGETRAPPPDPTERLRAAWRAVGLWEHLDLDAVTEPGARAAYRRLVNSPAGFVVLVGPGVEDAELRVVERLVERERPATAEGRAVRLQPWARLGGHGYLGVNTVLPTRALAVGRAELGADSVLVPPPRGP